MSNNIAQKLQAILSAKGDIKDAIEGKGVTVGSASLDQYASKIEAIQGGETDGLNGFLSVESKTIATSASQTTNITYNKNCGILDENYKKWNTLAWHQRWVDNGYSATGLSKPIGIWMDNVFGFDRTLTFLWPISDIVGLSDPTGTINPYKYTFQFFMFDQNPIIGETSVDRTVWPANQSDMIAHGTAGKYKSATFRTVNRGIGLDMICDNTGETFTIPNRDVAGALAYKKDNNDDYIESYYQQCEFCRALFAICSGVATTQPNGTTTTVEILNASGQQAAVNEDMYFWIGGTNTGLLAKYNLNSIPVTTANTLTGLVTQTISDAIYNKQKSNGVNMNNTGVNNTTKPVLLDGMKGAEAIAVEGYWYIKTPYISKPSTTFKIDNNIPDAPTIYICKARGLSLPSERMILAYYLNKDTIIQSILYLFRSVEGITEDIPTSARRDIKSAIRYDNRDSWAFHNYGSLSLVNTSSRFAVTPCCPATTVFTT